MRRGWEGAVLKVMRAKEFRFTVLETETLNEHYHRLLVDGGGLLERVPYHPTMWVRLWIDDGGAAHQRAYTLVDPDPGTGRFWLEFAVHDGRAPRWALAARPGDTVEVTLQGSGFTAPTPAPRRSWLSGDLASVPAVRGLVHALDAAGTGPVSIWLEYAHEGERVVPVLPEGSPHTVAWVPRQDDGRHLVEEVRQALVDADPRSDWFWLACEASSTRALHRHLRRDLGVPADRVHALAYWSAR